MIAFRFIRVSVVVFTFTPPHSLKGREREREHSGDDAPSEVDSASSVRCSTPRAPPIRY